MENELYGYKISEIVEFVGTGSERYLERFEKLSSKRKFNFAAAFFGGFWFGYRKMWLEGIIIMGCCAILDILLSGIWSLLLFKEIILDVDKTYEVLDWLIKIISFIAIGFIADSIYWKNIKKRIDFKHLPEEVRNKKIGFVTVLKECKSVSIFWGVIPMLFWRKFFNWIIIIGLDIVIELILWIYS